MKSGVFLAENQASTNGMVLYYDAGGSGGSNNNQYTIGNAKLGVAQFVNDTGTTGSTITLMNKELANNTTKHTSIGFVNTDTSGNGKFGGQIGFWPEDANALKQQFRIYTSGASSGYNLPVQQMVVDGDGNVGIGTTSPDGPLHLKLATNSNFTGFTYQTSDVKTVMANTGDSGSNISILQVYKSVQNRVPSAIDYHSETATASNVYTYCVNPYGGRIGLGTINPNSDLTMGARIYNTTGFVGLTGTKGNPAGTTTSLPYTQYSTTNPATGAGYYFVNPYPGQAQCTIVYDNAQTSPNGGLIYFYQNGPGYQPATYLPNSTVGTSEFTIPMLETGTIRINAIHMKPVDGCQIRITAVYWVPFRGVTANIREGGKLVLGTVGGSGTPTGSLSFRPEYEQPSGNQLEPKEKVENGLAWMTDLSTWHNGGLGGNGINWSKGNATYGVSTGARIWYQPGSFTSVSSGSAGNHGRLNLSAGYSTGISNTPDITITSNKRVGIGTTSPEGGLHVYGKTFILGQIASAPNGPDGTMYYNSTTNQPLVKVNGSWISLVNFLPSNISGLVGWYLPENWTGSQWTDVSAAGNDVTASEGTINYNASHSGSSVGANGTFPVLYGGISAELNFPTAILPSTYTLISMTRYNGSTKQRILDGQTGNWLSGHWGTYSGIAYHNGWVGGTTDKHGSNWVIGVDQNYLYRSKSQSVAWTSDTAGGGMTTNLRLGSVDSEGSDWMCAELIVYNRTLSSDEYTQVSDYIQNKYGIY